MKYTIQKITNKLPIYDGNKLIAVLNGYAFIDKNGHCMIIVYSEGKRDDVIQYLSKMLP